MPKLHITKSPFLDPIMTLAPDVHWVRAYAAKHLLGMDCMQFNSYQSKNRIPQIWDGERVLYLVDHREGNYGEGGKFYPNNSYGNPNFPGWRGHMVTPPKEKRGTCGLNQGHEVLKSMGLFCE